MRKRKVTKRQHFRKGMLAVMLCIMMVSVNLIHMQVDASVDETSGQLETVVSGETVASPAAGELETAGPVVGELETAGPVIGELETVAPVVGEPEMAGPVDETPVKEEKETVKPRTSVRSALEQKITEDTFISIGGQYTLEYLLTHYNVVSFEDVEATHVIGPVIAKVETKKYTTSPTSEVLTNDYLSISDYSKGIPSYLGSLTTYPTNNSTVKLDYGVDSKNPDGTQNYDFVAPNLYIGEKDKNGQPMEVVKVGEWDPEWIRLADGSYYKSTNNTGYAPTLQNDEFIIFSTLEEAMISESNKLYNEGSIEGQENIIEIDFESLDKETLEIDEYGYYVLDVDAGTSVRILGDTTGLGTVNIIVDDDNYGFYDDALTDPTTINFEDRYVNKKVIDGVTYSQFPRTTINGVEEDGKHGENGEYCEYGTKIIWNLPNVVTEGSENRMVTSDVSAVILGHVIAPKAEIWNIGFNTDGTQYWEGGNVNGTVIAKNFRMGQTEMHMYPYYGDEEPPKKESTSVDLKATKTLTGGSLADHTFEFVLDYVGTGTIGDYSSDWESMTVKSDKDGNIYFPKLKFEETGSYIFEVSEVNGSTSGVVYDKSVYRVTVTVTDPSIAADDMTAAVKIEKIKNNEGTAITDTSEGQSMAFFNKIEEEEKVASVELEATKQFLGGDLTKEDFDFELKYVGDKIGDYDSNWTPITAPSGTDGKINFSALKFNTAGTYIFEVSEKLPAGYETSEIIYDKTVYKVTIEVTEEMDASVEYEKVANSDGETINATTSDDMTFINKVKDSTSVDLEATKELTGRDLTADEFSFILEYIGTPIGDYDNSTWTPITATSDADGNIDFGTLEFDTAGTYIFQMSEQIPTDPDADIIYDQSVYEVSIEVTDETDAKDMTATVTYIQVMDSEGNAIEEPTTSTDETVTFVNKVVQYMDVTFTKVDMLDHSNGLEGAEFKVAEVTSSTDHAEVADGYSAEAVSAADGTFTFGDLKQSTCYKLTETKAPVGYELAGGYWIIEINEDATVSTVTQYSSDGEKIAVLTNNNIANMRTAFTLPETGGMGTMMYYITGLCILLGAVLLYRRRSNKLHA